MLYRLSIRPTAGSHGSDAQRTVLSKLHDIGAGLCKAAGGGTDAAQQAQPLEIIAEFPGSNDAMAFFLGLSAHERSLVEFERVADFEQEFLQRQRVVDWKRLLSTLLIRVGRTTDQLATAMAKPSKPGGGRNDRRTTVEVLRSRWKQYRAPGSIDRVPRRREVEELVEVLTTWKCWDAVSDTVFSRERADLFRLLELESSPTGRRGKSSGIAPRRRRRLSAIG